MSIFRQSGQTTLAALGSLSSSFTNRATFGAGCYWGTEKYFRYDFNKMFPGVQTVIPNRGGVGFMGPNDAMKNPSYYDVCSGYTKQVEVFEFEFTGDSETYRRLVQFFYMFHDPTTMNRQGNDEGSQYASIIYCHDEVQCAIAQQETQRLQQWMDENPILSQEVYEYDTIATTITPATVFYPAELDHQEYLTKNEGGYCNHRLRMSQWPCAPSLYQQDSSSSGSC